MDGAHQSQSDHDWWCLHIISCRAAYTQSASLEDALVPPACVGLAGTGRGAGAGDLAAVGW